MSKFTPNENDPRFAKVESEKDAALAENEATYGGMISASDQYYDKQIENSKEYAEKQSANQQAQTDFAIEQINQQKEQAEKDYTKEQSGAYVDWQKQSNQYGVNAEQRAANGMTNTGFSESAQVSMYNTYQNRVMAARETYSRAVLNYDNAIKDARLQNNAVLAEIAYKALQEQLELSLAGFQYKNQLVMEKANQKSAIEQNYWQRYLAVQDQINKENSMAESARQFDAQMAFQREQFNWQKAQAASSGGSSGGSSGRISKSSSGSSSKKSSSGGASISKSSSNSGPTVDMESVVNLGYGPISAKKLDQLIREGKVAEYEEGGKLKYKKVISSRTLKAW